VTKERELKNFLQKINFAKEFESRSRSCRRRLWLKTFRNNFFFCDKFESLFRFSSKIVFSVSVTFL